ncbi:hypothetical protein [Agrobacterium salinitolerans]|uniref:hypothetical protein n=1 Tax=Agrobacterium salinitolerans TaxID=1183413 RepID=UPI0022B81FD1|nr:hypothetical protein [Agrobacterium salinitolerans]MCZ7885388.1 hypothetical protein [Agrobacterium salinitolerans]
MDSVTRHISAGGLELPMNFVLRDFDGGSYVSLKMAFNTAWRTIATARQWLKSHLLDIIYPMVVEEAVGSGYIDAPNFYQFKRAWTRCRFFDGAGWLDPVREAQARPASHRVEHQHAAGRMRRAGQRLGRSPRAACG